MNLTHLGPANLPFAQAHEDEYNLALRLDYWRQNINSRLILKKVSELDHVELRIASILYDHGGYHSLPSEALKEKIIEAYTQPEAGWSRVSFTEDFLVLQR